MVDARSSVSPRARYVGIAGDEPDEVRRLATAIAWDGVTTTLHPPQAPVFAVLSHPGVRPAISVAADGAGRMVVVDGEVFGETAAGRPADAAAHVLAALQGKAIDALADLHLEGTVALADPDGTLHLARDVFG